MIKFRVQNNAIKFKWSFIFGNTGRIKDETILKWTSMKVANRIGLGVSLL